MTYVILAAGKGANLHPLTIKTPKSLYKLDNSSTVLQKMIKSIRKHDPTSEIVVVAGFMFNHILEEVKNENVIVVRNPFYSFTGSIASLWFARQYLERENVTILNSDIVLEEKLYKKVICGKTNKPYVLIDSSKKLGKYNVQIQNDRVCVMSGSLSSFYGQYACVTKLDAVSSRFLLEKIEQMINDEMCNLLFEDAIVQMIFENDFSLYYKDISGYSWTEVDTVDDLIAAKEAQRIKD